MLSSSTARLQGLRVLVLGGTGLLGAELVRQALAAGARVTGSYLTSSNNAAGAQWRRADLRDPEQTAEIVRSSRPDVILNAAYRQDDWASTAESAANVAAASADAGARLVFVSSDAVFSGADSPYTESAKPDPITRYGEAKAAAEAAVLSVSPGAVIARTSLIVSSVGGSAHERRVRAYATGEEDGILFIDDVRCPIHVTDLATALLELATTDRAGLHHLAGADAMSRYELGRLIAARDGLDPGALRPGLLADRPDAGPLDVRLDCEETRRHLRTELRGARTFLAAE